MNRPDFKVVLPCNLLSDKELDVALRTFSWFLNSVTNRHQRRSQLLAVAPSAQQKDILDYFWQKSQLDPTYLAISEARISTFSTDFSVLLFPSQRLGDNARVDILQWHLPTITFDCWERARNFDAGFGVFVPQILEDQAVREFGLLVRMLYFDPGALSVLRQQATVSRRMLV
jgi:hypothetical protein